jgi:hypothetical protein
MGTRVAVLICLGVAAAFGVTNCKGTSPAADGGQEAGASGGSAGAVGAGGAGMAGHGSGGGGTAGHDSRGEGGAAGMAGHGGGAGGAAGHAAACSTGTRPFCPGDGCTAGGPVPTCVAGAWQCPPPPSFDPPHDCVLPVAGDLDGAASAYFRCMTGFSPVTEICGEPSSLYRCPTGYVQMQSCKCFVDSPDQDCPAGATADGGAGGTTAGGGTTGQGGVGGAPAR